ncbi:conserved hypothetical protein, partial [Aspergillus udagawae]
AQPELLAAERVFSVDFTTPHPELSLGPLKHVNTVMPELSATLKSYRIALQQGGSIALGSGESLNSIRLGISISGVFSTDKPKVIRGPEITWTTLVLSAGPHFDGESRFQVGESLVEVLGDDLDLIRSGRPWQFLVPWPDREDCEKELKSTETALRELLDTKLLIHQALNETESLEEALRNRQLLVDQFHEGDQRCTPKVVDAGRTAAHIETWPDGAANEAETLTVASGAHQTDSADTMNGIFGLSEPRGQRSLAGLGDPCLLPENAEPGIPRSDFIQNLYQTLEEPGNDEAMRWSSNGRSFVLADESNFPARLLTRLSVVSYPSLIRRLYYYGFHKTAGAFHHDLFIRVRRGAQADDSACSFSGSPMPTPTVLQYLDTYKISNLARAPSSEAAGFDSKSSDDARHPSSAIDERYVGPYEFSSSTLLPDGEELDDQWAQLDVSTLET